MAEPDFEARKAWALVLVIALICIVLVIGVLGQRPSPAPRLSVEDQIVTQAAQTISKERGISVAEAEKIVRASLPTPQDLKRYEARRQQKEADVAAIRASACRLDPGAVGCLQ